MKRIQWFQLLSILIVSFHSASVHAAQVGKVVVEKAQVHQYPRPDSAVVGSVTKDDALTVSNVATTGYYKARLKDGTLGWISGNDILVGPATTAQSAPPSTSPAAPAPTGSKTFTPEGALAVKKPKKRAKPEPTFNKSRWILTYGFEFPSNSGLSTYFNVDKLNPRKAITLEYQFEMSENLYWALRAEYLSASVSNTITGGTAAQEISETSIPLLIGIDWSPIAERWRLGFGAYLGISPFSKLTITQHNTNPAQSAEYGSMNLTGLLNMQLSYGLGARFALIGELGYRYEQTGSLPETTYFGGVPAFNVSFSGVYGHAGIELRF